MRSFCLVAFLVGLSMTALAANPPRVLIIYDMEGVSGVSEPDMVRFDRPEKYALGRKSLTADVNAAIRGLKAGGAGVVLIQDGHGSGNMTGPDLLLDEMDKRATFDFHTIDFDPYSTGLDASLDAIVCIGMHPRARTPNGFMAHTIQHGRRDQSERRGVHRNTASAARFGVPVIMVSGDNTLGEELKPDFPEMEYVVGKISKSLNTAEPLPREEVDRKIEAAAKTAMEKFVAGKFRPYYLRPPFEFQLSWRNRQQASLAKRNPAVRPDGGLGVRFIAPTFYEGYEWTLKPTLWISGDSLQMLMRLLQQTPEGKKALEQLDEATWTRWLDPEHAPTFVTPPPAPPPQSVFWGDN